MREMFVTSLDTRRKKILQLIVEAHIKAACPISSQAIAQHLNQRISSATIRKVMVELEELGLVWQPHHSAGRIPTDKGYRYYIDSLLEIEQLSTEEKESIERQYLAESAAFDEFLKECLCRLSNFSGYTSLAFSSMGRDKLYIERTSCILEQPEFRDIQKLQAVLRVLERQEPLLEIMQEDLEPDGIKVHIGKENPCADIQDCSLVVSNFKIKNRNAGSLGIIGPRRMPYAKTISAVTHIARILDERLSEFTHELESQGPKAVDE